MASPSPSSNAPNAQGDPAVVSQVIQDTLARIAGHKGVLGYLVLNPKDGELMQGAGFGNNDALRLRYAAKLGAFVSLTQSTVRSFDHDDDLTFLRMRWRKREIIVAPDLTNREYILIVVHDQIPQAAATSAPLALGTAASPTDASLA